MKNYRGISGASGA